jgi:predicted nucleotidyltransferase
MLRTIFSPQPLSPLRKDRSKKIMEQKDYEIAKELKEKLSKIVRLIDFRVFGSRARGDGDEYSDMDVFLEIESLNKEVKNKIFDIIWEVGFKHFMVISPLIITREEVEKSPLKASPIIKNIVAEGVKV